MMNILKRKRFTAFLSMTLVMIAVVALFAFKLPTQAASAGLTIKFTTNGNWQQYVDHESPGNSVSYDTTNSDKSKFTVSGSDPYINISLSNYVTAADYIVYVRYAITNLTGATSNPTQAAVYYFKTDETNFHSGLTYSGSSTPGARYSKVGQAATLNKIRLDIPNNGTFTSLVLHLYEVYIGPPSGSPVKYTVTFNTDGGSAVADQSIGYNGKPTNPGTPTKTSTNSKAYTFKHWLNTATNATLSSAQVASTPITGDTTYKAIYTEANRYAVTYKKYDGTTIKTEYVTHGSKPTSPPANQTMTNTTETHYEWAGWKKNNAGNPLTAAQVKAQTITAATTFQASFNESYQVRFRVYNNNATYKNYSTAYVKYVPRGATISSVFPSLPPIETVYPTGDESTSTERYEKTDSEKVWRRVYVDGSGSIAVTESQVLEQTVSKAMDYEAVYRTKYAIRYYNGSTRLSETDWCYANAKNFAYNGTLPTKSGNAFVCWVRSTSANTDAVNTGTPQVPGSSNITGPTYFHARFLSTGFTGTEYKYNDTEGSETPGIVATRKVECTNTTNQTYRITTEIYTYGISDGYFDIMESIDGNFILFGNTPGHSMTVYRVPYSGNGKWGTAEEIGNKGGNGYVAVNLDPSGTNKIYNPNSGATSTGYWQLQWLNNSYTNENGKSFNINYFRTQAGLTEISRGNVTAPYGYKLRIVVTCKLDRDSIIGGNNVLISTPDYTYVNYIHGSDSTKNKSYPWSSKGEAITASEPKTNNDLVNVNVPIQYDFCVHDYYMDLYDVEKTHKTAANKVQQMLDKDKKQIKETYVGLINVLRNAAAGNHGVNNRAVYQYLFTHGNEPIFSWENRGKYSGTDTLYYNTDCDGVHNKYVNIQYKVVHEDARTVYETHCFVGNKSDDPTTESGASFSVKNNHNEAAVDFTKDHKVTVTTTVTSATTGVKDSFDNAVISNFSRSAESYFFAPRFVVADYSTTAYTSVQRESRIYDATFNTYKSAVDGAKESALTARTYGASAPARIYNHSDKDACDRIYYSFTTDYTHNLHPTTQRMINGVESVTFTTKVINVPKRMDSSEVNGTAPRKTIVRNFYVIPANVIAFDEGAITFFSDSEGNGVWNLTGDYKDPYQTSDADTRETEGANTTKTGVSYPANSIHGNNNAFLARTEVDYVGQSRMTTVDGSYTTDSAGNQVRANQERYGIFTFTGTGFDIISRTGRNTGVLVAAVYKGELTEEQCKNATPVQNILVDTYLDSDTLYQIPVIKYELKNATGGRTHGTYTVYFRAYYHEIFDHNLNLAKRAPVTEAQICELLGWDPAVPSTILLAESGDTRPATRTDGKNSYDVYVDGIRVYNTLGTLKEAPASVTNIYSNTDSATKYAAYAVYNCGSILSKNKNLEHFVGPEVNPVFYNVSDLLVDSGTTDWVGGLTGANAVNGILYIAAPMPDGYVDDNGGQTGNDSGSGDGLIHSGFHLGMSGVLYTETVNGKNYVYRMADTNNDGTPDTKERIKHNGQDVYYLVQNGKTVYYAGSTQLTGVQFYAACDQTVCYYDAKYDSIGPEHEIYLKKNSGIAMDIAGGNKAKTVHVGLRSLDGVAITVKVWDGTAWVNLCENLKTRTETYFDATAAVNSTSGKLYLKVTSGNYASIVNIKAVGGNTPSVSYRTIMDALEIFKAEAETPLVDEGMKISHSLNLAADISMNYAVPVTALEGVENSYMTVELPVYEGNTLVGSKFVTLEPVQQEYYYYYTLNGLTAVNMNDELKAELHYVRDGRSYVSATDHYSIARYAYIQLEKETIAPSLKTLCAELLRYGSYAQIFKGYRTDALADSLMTEAHRALLRDPSTVTFGSNNAVLEDLEAPAVHWNGKSLDLGSKVAVKFVFSLSDYEGRVEDLTLSVTYTAIDGTEKTAVITGAEVYNEANGFYVFTFDGLLAAELRSVLHVRVCENGTPISQTMVYSPDTYGNGKTDTLGNLCKALFAYSDAAKEYFLQ